MASKSTDNLTTNRSTTDGKKNNCMDILSDKLARLYMRSLGDGYKRETLGEKYLLIAAQNHAIRTNYTEGKINNI